MKLDIRAVRYLEASGATAISNVPHGDGLRLRFAFGTMGLMHRAAVARFWLKRGRADAVIEAARRTVPRKRRRHDG